MLKSLIGAKFQSSKNTKPRTGAKFQSSRAKMKFPKNTVTPGSYYQSMNLEVPSVEVPKLALHGWNFRTGAKFQSSRVLLSKEREQYFRTALSSKEKGGGL